MTCEMHVIGLVFLFCYFSIFSFGDNSSSFQAARTAAADAALFQEPEIRPRTTRAHEYVFIHNVFHTSCFFVSQIVALVRTAHANAGTVC